MYEYDQTSDKNNPITFGKFGPMDYGIRYQGIYIYIVHFNFGKFPPYTLLLKHIYAYLFLENEFLGFFISKNFQEFKSRIRNAT